MALTTPDNVALFHARAIRDYCADRKCKECVFCNDHDCELTKTSPNFWENIERRDLNDDMVD